MVLLYFCVRCIEESMRLGFKEVVAYMPNVKSENSKSSRTNHKRANGFYRLKSFNFVYSLDVVFPCKYKYYYLKKK